MGGTYPKSWGGTDAQNREGGSGSSGNSSSNEYAGPVVPGTSEETFRETGSTGSTGSSSGGRKEYAGPIIPGTSEETFRETGSSISISKQGMPDMPGEAQEKMIAAGVMHPGGQYKEIMGYYHDPKTGKAKFIAKGESVPDYHIPIKSEISDTDIIEKNKSDIEFYGEDIEMMPDYDTQYSSGTRYQKGIFDPISKKIPKNRFSDWYAKQKTIVGIGGAQEAKDYESAVKQYEILKFSGTPDKIAKKQQELESKYSAYEVARGVSPLAGKGIRTEKTFAYKAHKAAEKIRSDKPVYGGWQGDVSRIINEAIASNVEFLGGAPTMIRYSVPEIVKSPTLALSLGVVGGGEMLRSVVHHPIQSAATMAVTGGVIKGGVKGISVLPKPIYKPSSGGYGISSFSGKYKAIIYPKLREWRLDTYSGIKTGKITSSAYEKFLKGKIDRSVKKPLDFSQVSYRGLKIEDIPIKTKTVKAEIVKIKSKKISKNLIMGKRISKPLEKRYGLKDISEKFIKDIDPKFIKVVRKDVPDKQSRLRDKSKRYGLRDVPEEFIKDIDPKFIKAVRKDVPDKQSCLRTKSKRYGLRDIPEEFIKDIDPKFIKPIRMDIWKSEQASLQLSSPQLILPSKSIMKNWYDMGKSREIVLSKSMSHKGVKPVSKMLVGSIYATGLMAATKQDQLLLSKSAIKQKDAEKLKYSSIQYDKAQQIQMQKITGMQDQAQGQMELLKQDMLQYTKTIPKTYSVPKTTSKKFPKEEKIPKFPIPIVKKKTKKKPKKGKISKVKKQQIKNPIATVDQFMFEVMK